MFTNFQCYLYNKLELKMQEVPTSSCSLDQVQIVFSTSLFTVQPVYLWKCIPLSKKIIFRWDFNYYAIVNSLHSLSLPM